MLEFRVKKHRIISWILFVFLITLFVFWDIFIGPENSKYFSFVYLALGMLFMILRVPYILFKRAWIFFLLIIINFVALLVHFSDSASLLNTITLVISYTVLYYLVVGGMKYLGNSAFEETVFKYLLYVLLISLIVSPILTFFKWPYATSYYPWEALFSDKRFLLIVGSIGKDVGHSKAMWLMAFCGIFVTKRIFAQKTLKGNLVNILILFSLVLGFSFNKKSDWLTIYNNSFPGLGQLFQIAIKTFICTHPCGSDGGLLFRRRFSGEPTKDQ